MHSISSSAIILDTVVKSTLLLAIAWGAALVLKKRSAATQHMVRTFALAALLLLPFSVMVTPAWHIKGLPEYPRTVLQRATSRAACLTVSSDGCDARKAQAAPIGHSIFCATAPATRIKPDVHAATSINTQPLASASTSAAAPIVQRYPLSLYRPNKVRPLYRWQI